MAIEVVGSYASEEEVAIAIQELEGKGYKAENLTILTSKEHTDKLKDQTDVHVEGNISGDKRDESFKDKIKRAFTQDVGPEDRLSTYDKLISYGLTEEQASDYAKGVEAGNMLLIGDNGDVKGRPAPIADDNIDSLDRTGRTNLASDDLASTSEYQNINADGTEPSGNAENEEQDTDNEASREEEEEKVLDENPVLRKSTQERDGRSI